MDIWKDVKDFDGLYQVSNNGVVKALEKKVFYNDHRGFRINPERILKEATRKDGYNYIVLCNNGFKKTFNVHQLVAMAFLNHTPCGFKLVINHINFNKSDNRVENLEIVSMRENSNQKHLKSSSDFVGVRFNKRDNKWLSSIVYNKKAVFLGNFDSEIEAHQYYQNALISIDKGMDIKTKPHITSSNYKGVSWHNRTKKWRAIIYIKETKKLKSLGLYFNEIDAYNAYQNALNIIKIE